MKTVFIRSIQRDFGEVPQGRGWTRGRLLEEHVGKHRRWGYPPGRSWPTVSRSTSSICILALTLALAAVAAAPAAAQDGTAGTTLELADRVCAVWPALQRDDGSFWDYVFASAPGNGGYAEAMVGLFLLDSGTRTGDWARTSSGLRAIDAAVARPRFQSVFQVYAIATAYDLLRTRLAYDPSFAGREAAWAQWLRATRPRHIGGRNPLFNKYLVEAAAWLALIHTGLRSAEPGTVLFDPAGAKRRVIRLVGKRLPDLVHSRLHGKARRGGFVFADPPHHPLAYHAMSLGWLSAVVNLLGAEAPSRARELAKEGVQASLALTAPDGDLAYAGRAQEQGWTLALTAYAAETSALTAPRRRAAQFRGLATRLLWRLRTLHPITPVGMLITPAVGAPGGLNGLDRYAGAGVYNGLTMFGLVGTAYLAAPPGPIAPLPADRRGSTLVHMVGGRDKLATVRRGRVWFAVRQRHKSVSAGDLRYDQGLVALKRRGTSGWRDLVKLRPLTHRPGDSAGPLLLRRSRKLMPNGVRLRLGRRGRVHQNVRLGGRRTITYRPLRSGVRISWRARRGERFEYSVFLRNRPRQRGRTVIGGGLRASASVPLRLVRVERGYSSGRDARLLRVRMRLRARHSGKLGLVLR